MVSFPEAERRSHPISCQAGFTSLLTDFEKLFWMGIFSQESYLDVLPSCCSNLGGHNPVKNQITCDDWRIFELAGYQPSHSRTFTNGEKGREPKIGLWMLKTTILVTCYFVAYKSTTFVVAIRYFSQVGDLMGPGLPEVWQVLDAQNECSWNYTPATKPPLVEPQLSGTYTLGRPASSVATSREWKCWDYLGWVCMEMSNWSTWAKFFCVDTSAKLRHPGRKWGGSRSCVLCVLSIAKNHPIKLLWLL